MASALTSLSKLEQWLETTSASHSQSPMKNSCLWAAPQETFARTRLKTKCSFSASQCALKELEAFKQLLMTRFVWVVEMVKSFFSMSIKTSASRYCKPNSTEASLDLAPARTEFKCWLQRVKDLCTASE